MDAQMHADYYRARITFLEDVVKKGIERVSDQRKGKQESAHALRAGLKFTAELWRESQSRDSHVLKRRTAMSFIDPHDAQADDSHAPKIRHFSKIPVDSAFDDNVSALPSKHAAAEKASKVQHSSKTTLSNISLPLLPMIGCCSSPTKAGSIEQKFTNFPTRAVTLVANMSRTF